MPWAIETTTKGKQLAIASADREVCCHLLDSASKRLRIARLPTFLRIDRSDPACHLRTSSLLPSHDNPTPLVLIGLEVLSQYHARPPDRSCSQRRRQVDDFSGPTSAEQYVHLNRKWPGLAPSGWQMGLRGSELMVS